MKLALTAQARRDLRAYLYHIAADSPRNAANETRRVRYELEQLATLPAEGVQVRLEGWARPIRRWHVHPFRVYYERQPDRLVILRLYHHARRPIESEP